MLVLTLLGTAALPALGAGDNVDRARGESAFTYWLGQGSEGKETIKVKFRVRTSDGKIKESRIEGRRIRCENGDRNSYSVGTLRDGRVESDGRFKSEDSDEGEFSAHVSGRIIGDTVHGRARAFIDEEPIIPFPACDTGYMRWEGEQITQRQYENAPF